MIHPIMNDIVDFKYVQSGIIGDEERGCVIISPEMSFQAARLIAPEIVVKHANLFPYFGDKVNQNNDPGAYSYFLIKRPNDSVEVIGYPWVNEDTFKTVSGRIRIYNISNFNEKMAGPIAKLFADVSASYTFNDVDQ